MRHLLLALPALLSLAAQDDLPSRLALAQGLDVDALRDLQARLALSQAPAAARTYHEALLAYALAGQLDPKAAEPLVDQHLRALAPLKDAESLALRGALLGHKLGFSPASAMVLAPKASGCFEAALQAAPGNPRALLLQAVHLLHTPAFFGGGPAKALPLLTAAVQAAQAEAPAQDPWAPRWGRVESLVWLAIAQAQAKQPQEAEQSLAKAQALAPQHGMVGWAARRVARLQAAKG